MQGGATDSPISGVTPPPGMQRQWRADDSPLDRRTECEQLIDFLTLQRLPRAVLSA